MNVLRVLSLLMAAGICGPAVAQSIFNISPTQPQGVQRPPQTLAPAPQALPQAGPPPAQAGGQQPSSSLVDPKVMAQFDQRPNESNDAYLARLKELSQRSVADMERVSREHAAKMKALAPK